jgi:serine/threonine protein kinase/tetratricopeptide (TPR) repeat protein
MRHIRNISIMETQLIHLTENNNAVPPSVLSGGMLRAGENVGAYCIEGLISTSGSEAEIYLCSKNDEHFVLKYYYTKKPNLEVVEKIQSLSHQNIISILHYGEYNNKFFTVLEYAQGGALDEKKPDGTYKYLPLNDDEVVTIVKETIDAFDACHKSGIIHRDIKPGNLFYKYLETLSDNTCKGHGILVADFGIASLFEVDMGMSKHMTETGARTEGYAPPDAYSGVIGPEFDYYSLGITLWVLLTGKEPFINDDGQAHHSAQITLDTIQGKTVENLLSRSPNMSVFMQKLIRGLLTHRHDKRWKKEDVMRHLAGENVELFSEIRTLPLVEIGGESCASFQEIAKAIVTHPEDGKRFVFKGELPRYLVKVDQKLADTLLDDIDNYSSQKKEDEGAVFIAFKLCPNMAFPLSRDLSISSLQEMVSVMETAPEVIMPFLRDEKKGFYAYLESAGLAEHAKKVKEIINVTTANIRAVSRIIAAFQGNEIMPFQDGMNNNRKLAVMEDLFALPDYLKERVMIFIERNYGLIPAWIENISGKDIDDWLRLLNEKKDRIARLGIWEYFILFMQGLSDYDTIQKNGNYILYEKDGRRGLFCTTENSGKGELIYGIETDGGKLLINRTDGTTAFDGVYAVNLAQGYDADGISALPLLDDENRMSVFSGEELLYFDVKSANINSGNTSPRNELKDGELDLLLKLGTAVPVVSIAQSFKTERNFGDMNTLIENFWTLYRKEKVYESERNLLRLIDRDIMDGLSHPFDYYMNEIGETYLTEKAFSEALPYFEEALQINHSGTTEQGQSYYYNCAQALPFGDSDKIIECLDKAMSEVPAKPQPLVLKGECLFNLGKYNEAIASFTMALEMKSGTLSSEQKKLSLMTRAKCYEAQGMKEKSDADNSEANKLN